MDLVLKKMVGEGEEENNTRQLPHLTYTSLSPQPGQRPGRTAVAGGLHYSRQAGPAAAGGAGPLPAAEARDQGLSSHLRRVGHSLSRQGKGLFLKTCFTVIKRKDSPRCLSTLDLF